MYNRIDKVTFADSNGKVYNNYLLAGPNEEEVELTGGFWFNAIPV